LVKENSVRGIQLLGRNITDLAMNLNAGYAQYVRLTPEIIRSGSILKVPSGTGDVEAALVEPAACLLDCFEKSTHELGQNYKGSILKKGVLPGGVAAVIGSGSMAIMAGMMALMEDEAIEVGGAGEVVFFVRSKDKAELVRKVLDDKRVSFVIIPKNATSNGALKCLREQYAPLYRKRYGEDFVGFDDVVVAAGDKDTIALAHRMVTHTGGRVLAFAGTRGEVAIESGVWHYGNAGVVGTSGCNTKMMEIVLGLLERRSLSLARLSGRAYTFADLKEGVETFFTDTYLRPKLIPNEGLPAVEWQDGD
jgi:threonine dehydrogenase-like Zn-dependent dehydrogenase